jgi:hypothetical protein
MKSKLLIFVIIITVMLPLFVIPAFASDVVEISRPEGNEVVTKEIFSICGSSVSEEATIELSYKDKDGDYKPLFTTEGESTFTVGKIFGKDIVLKKGDNEIKIVAYTKSTKNDPQVKNYTITYTEEKKSDNWLDKALNWFTGADANEKK